MTIEKLSDRLRLLRETKAKKKLLADEVKALGGQIEEQERGIIEAMLDMAEEAGLATADSFTVTVDGRRYGVSTKPYYTIPAQQRDQAFAALRGLGLGDLIVERVDDRSLTRALMEAAEDAGGQLPQAYRAIPVRFFEKTTITDRKVGR